MEVISPQTGYHDAGERYQCLECGATGDADELVMQDATVAIHDP
jgi:hypothetical protein